MEPINRLRLAALQAQQLINLHSQKSSLVRLAVCLHRGRKQLKNQIKLSLRALTHKAVVSPHLRVLVHVRGGIGDVCMTRVFLKALRAQLPQAEIYLCYDSQSVVEALFQDGAYINGFQNRKYLPQDFDLIISGCHVFIYQYVNRARVEQLAPGFIPVLEKGLKMRDICRVFAENTPYLDGYWANATVEYGSSRVANLGLSTGLVVGQNDRAEIALAPERKRELLTALGLADKKYITIHDGINTNTDTSHGHPTRCWPQTRWREFAALFKQAHPDILLVQLGGSKSQAFDFADVCLVGKTAVKDLPYVLDGALAHVDGESGMVHLANLTHTRCVVLFGPSSAEYLGYAQNVNITSPKCQNCMNILEDWMTRCALNYAENEQCLAAITAPVVLDGVNKILGGK